MFLTLLGLVGLAFADEPKKDDAPPPVKVSGVLFGYWGMQLTDGAENYNEFGLSRVYVRADATINDKLGARVTLDADRFKPISLADGTSVSADSKTRVFVKHAYLEAKDLAPGLKLRAGMIDTPLGPYTDEFWGHRFIADNFAKSGAGIPTADFGVGLLGKHKDGLVDWQLNAVNGEGYDKSEVDAGKTVQARVSVDPMAPQKGSIKLPITGYVQYGGSGTEGVDPTIIAGGAVGLDMPYVTVLGQLLMKNQGDASGMGYSASLLPRVPKVVTGIVRYDHWDPSTDATDDSTTTMIVGASHHFAPKVASSLTYERTAAEAAPDAPAHGVFVRMLAGF